MAHVSSSPTEADPFFSERFAQNQFLHCSATAQLECSLTNSQSGTGNCNCCSVRSDKTRQISDKIRQDVHLLAELCQKK